MDLGPGTDSWRGTYAGPQAHWRCPSLADGAAFVTKVAEIAREVGVDPDLDLRPRGVTVQIRAPQAVTDDDRALARRVQDTARALGFVAAPELAQVVSLAVAHAADVDVRPFWQAALGYEAVGQGAQDPLRRGPFLSFQRIPKAGRGRTHVDVSVPAETARQRVAAALESGGRLAIDRAAPAWWTLVSSENHGVDIVAWPDLQSSRT